MIPEGASVKRRYKNHWWDAGPRYVRAIQRLSCGSSDRFRLNINLGFERAVNGTLVRDLEQLFLLFRIQLPHEMNVALNSVDFAFLGFAVPAIRRVNLRMTKIHGHTFKWPLLRSRVPGHGHRRAGT